MSNELDQLRADLATIKAAMEIYDRDYKGTDNFALIGVIEAKIARLEAEQADPWRDVMDHLEVARSGRGISSIGLNRLVAYYDHLTAENARMTARVAELEAFQAKWCDSFDLTDSDRKRMAALIQAESQPGPDDPILDPARVMATAKRWLTDSEVQNHGHIGFLIDTHCRHTIGDAKPYRLKGGENGS